jgi:hypothetical protein
MDNRLRIFALQASATLGDSVAKALKQPLCAHEEREPLDARVRRGVGGGMTQPLAL